MRKLITYLLISLSFSTLAAPANAQTVLRNFVFTLNFEGGSPITGSIFDEMGLTAPENGTVVIRGSADTTEPTFNRYDVTVNGIAIDNNLSSFFVYPDHVSIFVGEEGGSDRVFGRFVFDTPEGLFLGFAHPSDGGFDPQAILALGTYNLAPNATLTIAPVPEPAIWMLFILAFGAIGAGLRQRPTLPTQSKAMGQSPSEASDGLVRRA